MQGIKEKDIICLESLAFYRLIDNVVDHVEERLGTKSEDRWITSDEAMKVMGVTSRTTLQKYRDEGKIRYSQLSGKTILYDRHSILDFLDANAKDSF